MSEKPVQKGLDPKRFGRSAGDAPNLGRLSKVEVGSASPKGERRTRRQAPEPEELPFWQGMTGRFLMGLLVFLVIGFGVYLWGKHRFGGPVSTTSEDDVYVAATSTDSVQRHEFPSDDKAEDIVRRALAIRETRLVGDYFRTRSITTEQDVLDFLARLPTTDGLTIGIQAYDRTRLNGEDVAQVKVKAEKGGVVHKRMASLVVDEQGAWKVDFESFARINRPSLVEMLSGRANEGLVRAIIKLVAHDVRTVDGLPKGWSYYELSNPNHAVALPVCCWANSPQGDDLRRIMSSNSGAEHLTVRVRRATGEPAEMFANSPREDGALPAAMYEIVEVLADSWLLPKEDEGG